jgi:hypothetical protein
MKKIKKLLICFLLCLPMLFVVACQDPDTPTPDPDPDPDPTPVTDEVRVQGVSLGRNFVLYKANHSEKTNKRTEFFDLTKAYQVGDDNPWSFMPEVTFVKVNSTTGALSPTEVTEWDYTITLYVLENNAYVTADSSYVDAIDNKKCSVDFSEKAIGHDFRISVVPQKLTDKQLEKVGNYTVSFEFHVTDGYNCYSASDLAYIDNRETGTEEGAAWATYRSEKKLDTSIKPTSVILQTNIQISSSDIPSYFFYQEKDLSKLDSDYQRALGSMKDWKEIFVHNGMENENFTFEGNYYTLDASKLPVVVRESDKITEQGNVISHAVLFRFQGNSTSKMALQNTNIIGNAPKAENVVMSGGFIILKTDGPEVTCYNNISICSFIAYFPQYSSPKIVIEKCKAYDSFNSFIYNYGCSDVQITDCEMIGAGGPTIIQDHVSPNAEDGGHPGSVVLKNSVMESYVTGTEGWFSVVHASALIPAIKQLDALFQPFGRSFLKSNKDKTLTYFNVISVTKSDGNQGLTAEKVSGSIEINQHAFDFGKQNPYLSGLLDQTFAQGAPAFESSSAALTNGIGFTNGSALLQLDFSNPAAPTPTPILDATNTLFTGDYLCIYYQGMAIVVGFNQVGETI